MQNSNFSGEQYKSTKRAKITITVKHAKDAKYIIIM